MDEPKTQRFFSRRLLHLLWTVPLAAAASVLPYLYGVINLCGISGCTGGGFGVSYGPEIESLACAIIIGAFFTLAILIVPWLLPHRLRALIAAIIGAAIAGYLVFGGYAAKYEYYPANGSCYPTYTADPADCP
jgi:hypothetical protein